MSLLKKVVEWFAFNPPKRPSSTRRLFPRLDDSVAYFQAGDVLNATTYVLYCHGNAEDIEDDVSAVETIARRLSTNGRVAVVRVFDYPGYGETEGVPTEDGMYASARTAYDSIPKDGIDVVVWGRSLGSVPACKLAETLKDEGTPAFAVVLQSPLASLWRYAFPWFAMDTEGSLFCDEFDNLSRCERGFGAPTLLIHGDADVVVPVEHTKRLYDALTLSGGGFLIEERIVKGADHDVAPDDAGIYVAEFLDSPRDREEENDEPNLS